MKTAVKIFLLLNALGAISVGLQGLFSTDAIMQPVGIALNNPSAYISIMSSYGGVNLVFGLFYAYAAFKAQPLGLLLYLLYVGGIIFGRIAGFFQVGMGNTFVMTWFGVELVFLSLAFIFYSRIPKPNAMYQAANGGIIYNN